MTKFTLYLMGIYICDCMLSLFSSVLYTIAATRCSCRLRTLVLRNMLRQDVAFFDTVRVGELLNRLSTDTEVIQSVVTANLAGWFIPLCQVIVGLVAIFTYNWKLTLVVLSLIPVIAVCMFLQGFCMKILTEQELIALAEAGSKADETLSNIRTVRSYVMEEKEIANYADRINVSFLIIKRRAWISGTLAAVTNLCGDSCILVAMWYGGQLIFQNEMSVGGLVSYMLFALQSVFAFSSLISIFPQFMEAIGASGRIFELLDRFATPPPLSSPTISHHSSQSKAQAGFSSPHSAGGLRSTTTAASSRPMASRATSSSRMCTSTTPPGLKSKS